LTYKPASSQYPVTTATVFELCRVEEERFGAVWDRGSLVSVRQVDYQR